MAFLALSSQKTMLTLQKNLVEMELIHATNQQNYYTQQMGIIEANGADNYDQDPNYQMYKQMDDYWSIQKDSIQDQVTEINTFIQSLQSLTKTEIQSSCKMNLAGGS